MPLPAGASAAAAIRAYVDPDTGLGAEAVTAGAGEIVVAGATGSQTPNSLLGVWVYQP